MITKSGEFNIVESFARETDKEVLVVCGCEDELIRVADPVGGRHEAIRSAEGIE